jgi:thiamine-monophosphate kinase
VVSSEIPLLDYSPLDYALKGGEDFALLFTVPAQEESRLRKELTRPVYRIGKIVKDQGLFLLEEGIRKPVSPAGFDHFPTKP